MEAKRQRETGRKRSFRVRAMTARVAWMRMAPAGRGNWGMEPRSAKHKFGTPARKAESESGRPNFVPLRKERNFLQLLMCTASARHPSGSPSSTPPPPRGPSCRPSPIRPGEELGAGAPDASGASGAKAGAGGLNGVDADVAVRASSSSGSTSRTRASYGTRQLRAPLTAPFAPLDLGIPAAAPAPGLAALAGEGHEVLAVKPCRRRRPPPSLVSRGGLLSRPRSAAPSPS